MSVTLYHKLLEACRRPGCPICTLEEQTARRYLENLLYENVNSPAVRRRLRNSWGFCREHAWLAVNEHLGDALGIALLYHDLVAGLISHLESRKPRLRRSWLAARPASEEGEENARPLSLSRIHCPVCQQREETAKSMIAVLIKHVTDEEMRVALAASNGLCLPHLLSALEAAKDETTYLALLSLAFEKLISLNAELREFIRKNDYRYVGEGFGKEGDSWKRAVAFLVGNNPSSDEKGKT